MCGARMDVLPAIGFEERALDGFRLNLIHIAAAARCEIPGIISRLYLKDTVDCSNQLDEIVDSRFTFLERETGITSLQLELVEDRVLALFLPVIEEDVLEQLGQLAIRIDAFTVVELCEQLDVQRQRKHCPR